METGVEAGTTPPIQTSISFDINTDIPFPSDNPWNQDISSSPLDPNSAMYINALGTTQTLHPAFGTVWDGAPNGQAFVVVSGTQKKVPMSFYYQSDPGPYPIPADAPIQGGPNSTGDRHVIVIDKDNGLLYEIWDAHPDGSGGWNAGSGAIFNLHSNGLRPAGWTSADAAGLPIYPGLIRYQEVSVQKVIRHAIRFTADRTTSGYVYPARHFAGISDPTLPPMGMRVRLKANYDISGFSPNNKVILTAMKKYGMILADNGVSWQFSGEPSPNWDDNELHDLRRVPGSAFEVVEMGAIQR
ncbi:MAG: hypothetical protein H7281_04285 [Bacteriovorax sp.]|nr:hypothetical protein [Bacteriovorax sp.]